MANAKTITAANSQLAISVVGIFNTPVVIQGYAMDSAFQNDAIQSAEVTMGVDGFMSAGFVFKEVKLKITLSPDSPSKAFFDQWYNTMFNSREVYFANASLNLPATGEGYTFTRGVLSNYHGVPAGKKKLEPVEYEITWQSVQKANL
jgi:hypothetical protein